MDWLSIVKNACQAANYVCVRFMPRPLRAGLSTFITKITPM